ncbi:MAG: ribonuclease P protein component [Synergistaceae bacterium]|jgi:ribonuclease P protein component|nr:ribonuclease P protein component [Synergistaceae bacterium]
MAHRFGFPRTSRLTQGWQFDLAFRTGRRIQGELVRLLFLEAPDGMTRIGVAVGKRQGKAVVRSRGRRVLREAARRLLPWIRPGYWFVLTLSGQALQSGARPVYEDLACLLQARGFLDGSFPGPDWTPWEEDRG